VAFEIAQTLHVPMDVFLVRKLGVPRNEELAMGAIATGGVRLLQPDVVEAFHISQATIDAATEEGLRELDRREKLYRDSRSAPVIEGQIIILVDDGLATGCTMRVAAAALKQQRPKHLIAAVPVAGIEALDGLGTEVNEILCAETPDSFAAVGHWYEDFSQVSDEEVGYLLQRAMQSFGHRHPFASELHLGVL